MLFRSQFQLSNASPAKVGGSGPDSQPIGMQSRLSNASPVRIQDLIHNQSGCNSNYPMLRPSGFRTRFTTIRDPISAIQCFARTDSGSDSQPFAIQSRLSNASPVRVQDLIHTNRDPIPAIQCFAHPGWGLGIRD